MAEEGPRIIEHVNKSLNWSTYDARWIPNSAKFAAIGYYARGSGTIQVYSLKQNGIELVAEKEHKDHMFKCCTFDHSSPEERRLATGGMNGSLCVWDLERMAAPIYNVRAHEDIVHSIDGCGSEFGPPELVTASRDGCVKVFDLGKKTNQ